MDELSMTLRDYFAGCIITGQSEGRILFSKERRESLAKVAYEMADAMIAARDSTGKPAEHSNHD